MEHKKEASWSTRLIQLLNTPISFRRNKKENTENTRSTAVGYGLTGVVILLYTLFLDIRFGLTILILYFGAPVVSYCLIKTAVRKLQVSILHTAETTYEKSEQIRLSLRISCDSYIPLPLVYIQLYSSSQLNSRESDSFVLSVLRGRAQTVHKAYTAMVSGAAILGVRGVKVFDFLGIFAFTVPWREGEEIQQVIGILPEIPELQENAFFNQTLDAVAEEDEEETATEYTSFRKILGYEHREYVPGDSLKRINWKLSSKQDKLWVRQEEAIAGAKQVLVLDRMGWPAPLEEEEAPDLAAFLAEERAAEAALGIIKLLLRHGHHAEFWYHQEGWKKVEIEAEADLLSLREALAGYGFDRGPDRASPRIPVLQLARKSPGSCLIFSPVGDAELFLQAAQLSQNGSRVRIAATEKQEECGTEVWRICEDYEFTL